MSYIYIYIVTLLVTEYIYGCNGNEVKTKNILNYKELSSTSFCVFKPDDSFSSK